MSGYTGKQTEEMENEITELMRGIHADTMAILEVARQIKDELVDIETLLEKPK